MSNVQRNLTSVPEHDEEDDRGSSYSHVVDPESEDRANRLRRRIVHDISDDDVGPVASCHEHSGDQRPPPSLGTTTDQALARSMVRDEQNNAKKSTSSTRADREREEKMRSVMHRGRRVPRARPLRQGDAAKPRVTPSFEADKQSVRGMAKACGKQGAIPVGHGRGTEAEDVKKKPMSLPADFHHDGPSRNATNDPDASGTDQDEKARQRILARSNLRRSHPRRPHGAFRGGGSSSNSSSNNNPTASRSATTTDRRRPSDDKRNLRISRRTLPSSSPPPDSSTQQHDPHPASGTARRSRPSDEKAAFRRRRQYALAASTPRNRPSENDSAEPSADRTGAGGSEPGTPDLESFEPQTTTNPGFSDPDNGLEAPDIADNEPEILPGAFAVSGIGDEEEGQGVSGYDSGFEDDTDGIFEAMPSNGENALDLERRDASWQPNHTTDNDVTMANTSAPSITTSTPLPAELYEVETAVSAEILIIEEDPDETRKIRKLSVQMSCALLSLLLLAGITMGSVLPWVVGKNRDSIDAGNTDEDGAPTIEGWRPVGNTLAVEDSFKDNNIRFGNSVSISADGDRIAVGIPGLDDSVDNSLKSIGGVQIFDLVNDTTWEEQFKIAGTFSNAELGTKVVLSDDGKRVAIGAPSYDSEENGHVLIYEELDASKDWKLIVNISNTNNDINEGVFGDALGFSGDGTVIAIGDKYGDVLNLEDSGMVIIYQEVNGTWKQMGESILGTEKGDLFGWSVTLSKDGNRIAVSSPGSNEKLGGVQVFYFNGTSWEGVGSSLIGESSREFFGFSVALSGDASILAASAIDYSRNGQEANVGIVRSYQYDMGKEEWSPYGQPLEGEDEFDAFGTSIALSYDGGMVAVGGPENGSFCDGCGHIKVFQSMGDAWATNGSALGKSGIDGGKFGYAVALSSTGNRIVGAAPFTTFNGRVSEVGEVLAFEPIDKDLEGE